MQIKATFDLVIVFVGVNPILNLEYLGIHQLRSLFPPPIEVGACYVASKITIDDSIHVHHWKYLEYVVGK
jgi:hypothetical protein